MLFGQLARDLGAVVKTAEAEDRGLHQARGRRTQADVNQAGGATAEARPVLGIPLG
jgi:hypothetical protein